MHLDRFDFAYVQLREWSESDRLWPRERARAAGIVVHVLQSMQEVLDPSTSMAR